MRGDAGPEATPTGGLGEWQEKEGGKKEKAFFVGVTLGRHKGWGS